jgi:predicted SnoaL-like aldol condensation-catalyzing enzyme
MDVTAAACRWARVWERAWPAKDREAIVALYDDTVRYRALVQREPEVGVAGVRAYLQRIFAEEDAIECRFGEPVADRDRAAVEWWASWTEAGADLTMAGVTVLRFDADGKVVDHRDYWNQSDRREPPFDGW